jgi:dTMP kinase
MRQRGRFVTFDGIDGAGKTTHLRWFHERLAGQLAGSGASLLLTREPGGTPLGERLREIVLNEEMGLDTEALLMFAARREHIERVIEPALACGDWVLSDRFTDATFAYQGGGRGMARERLETLEDWAQRGLHPDLTVLFDIPVELAQARRRAAREADRFERQSDAFFARVRDEYLRRAGAWPARYVVIDAALPIDAVRARLEDVLATLAGADQRA